MQDHVKAIFLVALLCQGLSSAQANGDTYLDGMKGKLAVGATNVAAGWLEIPKNMMISSNEYNVLVGISGGLLKGVLHTLGRTLVGTFDLVTFPLPSQPIAKPAYVYESFKDETRYGPIPF